MWGVLHFCRTYISEHSKLCPEDVCHVTGSAYLSVYNIKNTLHRAAADGTPGSALVRITLVLTDKSHFDYRHIVNMYNKNCAKHRDTMKSSFFFYMPGFHALLLINYQIIRFWTHGPCIHTISDEREKIIQATQCLFIFCLKSKYIMPLQNRKLLSCKPLIDKYNQDKTA